MRIAIYDTEHFETAYTIILLFRYYGHDVRIYTDHSTERQLRFMLGDQSQDEGSGVHSNNISGSTTWFIRDAETSRRRFIRRCFADIRQHKPDLLYLSTVPDNHYTFASALRKAGPLKTVLTIHDVNAYFRWSYSPDLRRLVRYLGRRRLISQADALQVLAESMVHGLETKLMKALRGRDIPVFALAGGLYEGDRSTGEAARGGSSEEQQLPGESVPPGSPEEQQLPGEAAPGGRHRATLHLVIPGSIDERRRNYASAFELLDQAKTIGLQLRVTLLGVFNRDHSRRTREMAGRYRRDQLITFDDETIDQPLFDEILASADLLWMPMNPEATLLNGVSEQYGRSIMSGNMGDAIRHGKPFIIPAFIEPDGPLTGSAMKYHSIAELLKLLEDLDRAGLERLTSQARDNAMAFLPERVAEAHEALFRDLIIPSQGRLPG